jgi:hypothetical protein
VVQPLCTLSWLSRKGGRPQLRRLGARKAGGAAPLCPELVPALRRPPPALPASSSQGRWRGRSTTLVGSYTEKATLTSEGSRRLELPPAAPTGATVTPSLLTQGEETNGFPSLSSPFSPPSPRCSHCG